MKKAIIILSALLTFVACNTEIIETETDTTIDASKVVFNIKVNNSDEVATKGVKTDWESGDVVYVFFEDNTNQYVKMTYDGSSSSWAYSDKDGTTIYNNLSLTASGKKLSAVYMPKFVIGSATPIYSNDDYMWTIGSGIGGFILTAEKVAYEVTVGDVTTLSATLEMTAPKLLKNKLVQVYISESASKPAEGNEYVLNMTNVKPFTIYGIEPGGTAVIRAQTTNYRMIGYDGTLGNQKGSYFWGILDNASLGETTYQFQLVEQNATYKYAISSKAITKTEKELTGSTAIKLDLSNGCKDNGNFVSLGYSEGPLWATGNIGKKSNSSEFNIQSNAGIVDPLMAGEYFMYGYVKPYDIFDEAYTGTEDPLSPTNDVANRVNNTWSIPTLQQFQNLISYTSSSWVNNCTDIGPDSGDPETGNYKRGGLLVTSKSNGISLFFAAAGHYNKVKDYDGEYPVLDGDPGYKGFYWSSSYYSGGGQYGYLYGYFLSVSPYALDVDPERVQFRKEGLSVRPVKN